MNNNFDAVIIGVGSLDPCKLVRMAAAGHRVAVREVVPLLKDRELGSLSHMSIVE
jgi:hypothetical protein